MKRKVRQENYRSVGVKFSRRKFHLALKNSNMVAMHARAAYNRLPWHTRQWIGFEDFLQEGLLEAATTIAARFNPKKKVQFTTYMYQGLSLFFKTALQPHFADMRYEGRTSNLDDLPRWQDKLTTEESVQLSGAEYEPEEDKDSKIANVTVASQGLVCVLKEASPQTQAMIVNWFIQPRETKFHLAGKRFAGAKKEFLQLCQRHQVSESVCAEAMRNEMVKAQLAKAYQDAQMR